MATQNDGPPAKRAKTVDDALQSLPEAIRDKCQLYMNLEKEPTFVSKAEDLITSGDEGAITRAFGSYMQFGTAGLRSTMSPGWACMNDLTVIQATQGLCDYILEQRGSKKDTDEAPCVVIGHDARYNSHRFARRAAAVMLTKGIRVHLFSDVVATPMVPFSVRLLKASAGIMVTASHNPGKDNGYKVYWGNGAQIIPPHDTNIAAHIEKNRTAVWDGVWSLEDPTTHELCSDPLADVTTAYFRSIKTHSHLSGPSPLFSGVNKQAVSFAYTAMHGVGHEFVKRAAEAFELPAFVDVPKQVKPHPDFPTVDYPNPEEGKGALKLAIETAEQSGCRVILANDPDADRLAIACLHNKEWRVLNGNETGALFAWWLFHIWQTQNPGKSAKDVCMIASAVSSKLIGAMAAKHGFQFYETLTGFKWMGNEAERLASQGCEVLFSFEEAIGFCIGTTVLDKDGVCASVVAAEMALYLASKDMSLVDQLERVYGDYGFHPTYNSYFICQEPKILDEIFSNIRKDYPKSVAGVAVKGIRDVTTGYDSSTPDKRCRLPQQSGHMITFTMANDVTLTLRTSGTEPKVKFYSERRCGPEESSNKQKAQQNLEDFVDNAVAELLQPKKYGLQARKSS